MSAETLRRAADLLDELAGKATPGPWVMLAGEYVTPVGILVAPDDGGVRTSDAAYIARMSPEVGKALAAWLRQAGMDEWAHGRPDCCTDGCDQCDDDLLAPHLRKALAVARAILREGGDQ